MTNETLRMQFLSGVITESEYKVKLQENAAPIFDVVTMDEKTMVGTHQEGVGFKANKKGIEMGFKDNLKSIPNKTKKVKEKAKAKVNVGESLNESMIGGIVGIGAINQIPPRAKADYETAFEHFLGGKYGLNEVEEVNENMFKVGNIVRITAPLDISAETDEGTITKVYPNFNSIPSEDIGYYEVDADAYDESALNGPWYKVDHNGEEELYPAEELELN